MQNIAGAYCREDAPTFGYSYVSSQRFAKAKARSQTCPFLSDGGHVLCEAMHYSQYPGKKTPRPYVRPSRVRSMVSLFHPSLTGIGGADAISLSTEFGRLSAWKAIANEVELPVQGLDLVIHVGNEVINLQAPSAV